MGFSTAPKSTAGDRTRKAHCRVEANSLDSGWAASFLQQSMNRSSMQRGGKRSETGNASRKAEGQPNIAIREVDEARSLLEKQLHSVYWWVFNACRIKGFLRAKALAEQTLPQTGQTSEPAEVGSAGSQSN
jgi:hypothetical protein